MIHPFKHHQMERTMSMRIHKDPLIQNILPKQRPPKDWHQRALYLGESGYNAWRTLFNVGQTLSTQAQHLPLHFDALKQASLCSSAPVLVSLGSGTGDTDKIVVETLRTIHDVVTYIPVDLNLEFLLHATEVLSLDANIPFAVQTDFEANLFLRDVLRTSSLNHPILFGLLGITFGNFDLLESNFIKTIAATMHSGDFLMFDVAIGDGSSAAQNPMYQNNAVIAAFNSFLVAGIARQTSMTIDKVLENLSGIHFVVGESDVEGTVVTEIRYGGRKIQPFSVLRYCEYSSEDIVEWINRIEEFELVGNKLFEQPKEENCYFAVALLRRR
ncbi:conserved hypothetical protein [Beggiatoa sp. PS]|nr:conserved hypothetical protein [Beggiatoa sp. PS]